MISTAPARAFRLEPYEYSAARAIASRLGLSEPTAVTLVRRGFTTPDQAAAFLRADEAHDPFAFDSMEAACELVLARVADGGKITVHGDYDVDGVASTAILVGCLRELGAEADWLIPDRLSAGYGLSTAGVEELRRRSTRLLITADCGIGSAAEVRAARAAGIEVIVTDHHQPPAEIPDCTVLHPVVSRYPFEALCGSGVAHKLAAALRGAAGLGDPECDLDLVALATVADMVPLLGENRRLVREGLLQMRTRPRAGLSALMRVSRTDPESLDAGALGFRLAPRINAAGRLYRADAGVELLLTEDPERAAAIASELDRANQERRAVERELLDQAERARAALPREQREGPALVLAGAGWHRGVVGIVASRLVERYWRPVVLIGLEHGRGRGSARSIPGLDLVRALEACAGELTGFGGHRMAAGLELEAERVEAFRRALLEYAGQSLAPADLVRSDRIDAVVGVGAGGVGLELAEQLERLGPFGAGNPEPRLLVPSARLENLRPLGEEGRHARFDLVAGAGRAQGVAFGVGGELAAETEAPQDLAVAVELDRWNGAIQPRVLLRDRYRCGPETGAPDSGCGDPGCPELGEEWWRRMEAEIARSPGMLPDQVASARRRRAGHERELVDRRGGATVAAIGELASSGAAILVLCADAGRRRELVTRAADPVRLGGPKALIACCRCGGRALDDALGPEEGPSDPAHAGIVLSDWGAVMRRPRAASRFAHVLVVDPPPLAELGELARLPLVGPAGTSSFAAGFIHLAWGPVEIELARLCLQAEWELRPAIGEIWRALGLAEGEAEGPALARLLAGAGRLPRTPEVAARCVRALRELGLCEWEGGDRGPRLTVVSDEPTELARSPTYLACRAEHERRLAGIAGSATDLAAAA